MFFIDTLLDIPIYTQICNGIIKEIADNNLKNGDSLLSVRQLAQMFNINPMTVNKAYGILKNENIIEIDRKKGAVISIKCEESNLKKIEKNLQNLINEIKARNISKDELIEMIERSF